MSERVGAVHLGWDVLTVAAGHGARAPVFLPIEGDPTPPAALLADRRGQLHTRRADPRRTDLGTAIADVRDIVGHNEILIAGATWPTQAVFRARLHNALDAIAAHLGGPIDVLALPYPDAWPDATVERFAALVGGLGVAVEPIPESVALAGYVRGAGAVAGHGATVVYCDGRSVLVVAVGVDENTPTESVGVAMLPDAARDPRVADRLVFDVLGAARSIGADTGAVVLAGNVVYNEVLRLAFKNQFGRRLELAEQPVHAIALGAARLVIEDPDVIAAPVPPRTFGAPSPADVRPTVAQRRPHDELPTEVIRRPHVAAPPRGIGWKVAAAVAVVLLLVIIALVVLSGTSSTAVALTDDEARGVVTALLLPEDAIDGMIPATAASVTTGGEMTSLACGSIPLTTAEAGAARVSAARRFVAPTTERGLDEKYRPGDAIETRVVFAAADAHDDIQYDIVKQLQICPNGEANDVRYVVPVPTSGADPGPPRQVGSTSPVGTTAFDVHARGRLVWRGLSARNASPTKEVEHVTCLLDSSGEVFLRACGMSVESSGADKLAALGMRKLHSRQDQVD